MRNNGLTLFTGILVLSVLLSTVSYADPFRKPAPEEVLFFAHPGCLYDNAQEVMSVRVKPGKSAEEVGDLTKFLYYGTDGSGSWDKRISCMRVGPDVRVEAYQSKSFKGQKQEYGPGNHDIAGGWWDDSISSLKITKKTGAEEKKPAEKKPVVKKKKTASNK